jgi:hypothetical protein
MALRASVKLESGTEAFWRLLAGFECEGGEVELDMVARCFWSQSTRRKKMLSALLLDIYHSVALDLGCLLIFGAPKISRHTREHKNEK